MKTKFKISKQLRVDLVGYSFILPNIIGVFIFTIIPMVFSLIISFTDWDFVRGLGNWNYIGLKNFIDIWRDPWFTNSLRNTIIFSVCVVTFTISLALVISVLIDRYCLLRLPIRLAMFMPYISNIVAISIVWIMMYSPWGPVTQILRSLGVENPPQWLGDYFWSLPAVIIVMIWCNIGYAIIIYTSSIQGIPTDVYEAAEIDGANEVQKFWKITVPFLSPITFFLTVTIMVSSFQVFAPIQLMTRGGPGSSSSVLVYYIYTSAFTFYRMGYAAAISWIMMLLLFAVTLIQWKNQRRKVEY